VGSASAAHSLGEGKLAVTTQAAGGLDRRIEIQHATSTTDQAGDAVLGWNLAFKRWAQLMPRERSAGQVEGAQMVTREAMVTWRIRHDSQSLTIAPETHRVIHSGRIFRIIGIELTVERNDTIDLVCSHRPDLRGASGLVAESG
jgi:head-tail adaptor